MLNIVLFGPPGAGKGTQSSKLIDKYGVIHLSTGDIFRANIKSGTELGDKARSFIDRGQLVPDEVTIAMLESEVNKHPDAQGFIFDGFPRTAAQAEALDALLAKSNSPVKVMLALEVDESELRNRLMFRGKESGRVDDQDPEIIQKRIDVYNYETSPVKEFYEKQDKYRGVSGIGEIEEIFNSLCEIIDEYNGGSKRKKAVNDSKDDVADTKSEDIKAEHHVHPAKAEREQAIEVAKEKKKDVITRPVTEEIHHAEPTAPKAVARAAAQKKITGDKVQPAATAPVKEEGIIATAKKVIKKLFGADVPAANKKAPAKKAARRLKPARTPIADITKKIAVEKPAMKKPVAKKPVTPKKKVAAKNLPSLKPGQAKKKAAANSKVAAKKKVNPSRNAKTSVKKVVAKKKVATKKVSKPVAGKKTAKKATAKKAVKRTMPAKKKAVAKKVTSKPVRNVAAKKKVTSKKVAPKKKTVANKRPVAKKKTASEKVTAKRPVAKKNTASKKVAPKKKAVAAKRPLAKKKVAAKRTIKTKTAVKKKKR